MKSKASKIVWIVLLMIGGLTTYYWIPSATREASEGSNKATARASGATQSATSAQAVPVTATGVVQGDVPVVLEGLGTITPINTAVIRTQVQGTLESVDFIEGQLVKRGAVLAKIDPRVFQAQVDQAKAALSRDEATLKNSRANLARTQPLADRGFATMQQLDTQNSQVAQGEGTIQLDQAALEAAQTQLSFTTITAPFDGITGIRRIDPGNIVQPSDINGLVVLTQLEPIAAIFTLPSTEIPNVQKAIASGEASVDAYDASNRKKLDHGTLMLIDNQVDSSTGTVRLKALFANASRTLWPGAFVNVHLTLSVRKNALTIPLTAALQGPKGAFAYVVGPDNKVTARNIVTGQSRSGKVLVQDGLAANEIVVTAGQYRLTNGKSVEIVPDSQISRVQNATTASAGMLP
ncbi:efflux RND transporter periplasmic adaptor subunit [Bradyrhizobium vignae]|uniref:Efflux transporter, RND family, MFP subunit n=1 Tax=Bradyrhizobium vignae TaxID=1549949 RepID=A0A2U3PV86_9BRAD|nr:efflux RND transporter periplasmic adaptor subunit [Bradyrhizobium vignae]SPP93065.1 Efflux transporter, RND family, MFP subunit [Bradyrhizobium vignae]